jgi:hypothetical protein
MSVYKLYLIPPKRKKIPADLFLLQFKFTRKAYAVR